ncbi:WRKY transcription factor [Sarracenia purpurea var. burkii]
MENSADWEEKSLIKELTQGMELAKQLQMHLNVTSSSSFSSSPKTREWLVQKILNSYDKALSMVKWKASVRDHEPQPITGAATGMSESPRSLSGSPHSEDSYLDFKGREHTSGSRKRKTMAGWTKQVQVCAGTGLEGPLDDGYNWRKYGQKDILGAKYPRGYYRCSHRNMQGCLATKQVQRSDENPTIFEITYRGRHTCTGAATLAPPPSPSSENQEPNTALDHHQQQLLTSRHSQQTHQNSQETLWNFQTGLRVMTEDLDAGNSSIPSFYLPPPPPPHVESASYVDPSTSLLDDGFVGNFSPSFMYPAATSGSSYFSVSLTDHMVGFGRGQNLNLHAAADSELAEIVSAATSTTSSPTVGLDGIPFGAVDPLEPSFSFDNPGFFF